MYLNKNMQIKAANFMAFTAVRGLTCNAADLRQTHHDLGKAFGLMWVLVLSEVLTHIPVTLVQLLKLGDIGQSSDICMKTGITVQ